MIEENINTGEPENRGGFNFPVPEIYTNSAIVNINPYEFEITLGLGSGSYEGVRPLVNLRVSPQFIKEFSLSLARDINEYEEKFGEIRTFQNEEE